MHFRSHQKYGDVRTGEEEFRARRKRRTQGSLGRWVNQDGYVMVGVPDSSRRYAMEHRQVMAQHLGRELLPHEYIHHLNGIRDDNRLENLELWSSSQPKGQRVEDKVAWAIQLLQHYRPDALSIG
jgi:hypothetical protein